MAAVLIYEIQICRVTEQFNKFTVGASFPELVIYMFKLLVTF